MKKPRWYQHEALAALWQYLQTKKGNPLVAMPTGTGKSLVIAEFMRGIFKVNPRSRFIVATHKEELIVQDMEELVGMWPGAPCGVYSAALKRKDAKQPIIFASIDSAVLRPELFGHVDYLLVDEAHLVDHRNAARYAKFIAALTKVNSSLRVIGFTATPYRMGLGMLTNGDVFDDVAYNLCSMDKFNRLLDEGYLAPLIPREPDEELDITGVHIRAGEYVSAELQRVVDVEEKSALILEEAQQLAKNRNSWLIYCTGKAHCENIAKHLNTVIGIPSTYVHSGLRGGERQKRIENFKKGNYRALVNADILTTGFNFPALDCIIVLRPTASVGLWVQMLGRGTRPAKGKTDCLVLDFAGNTRRLGPINDPVIPHKKGKGKGGTPPVRVCPVCHVYMHASLRSCTNCGYVFPVEDRLDVDASTAKLVATEDDTLINDYSVKSMTCIRHTKTGKPDSLRIEYRCGLRTFKQYLCFEHQGYAAVAAARKWVQLGGEDPAPWTIDEALRRVDELRIPKSITVSETRKGYPEIIGMDVDLTSERRAEAKVCFTLDCAVA